MDYLQHIVWPPERFTVAVTPVSLTYLHGPKTGILEPPVSLWWQPSTITAPHNVAGFYAELINNTSVNVDTLVQWINPTLLMEQWEHIFPKLTRSNQMLWEFAHPQLHHARRHIMASSNVQLLVQEELLDCLHQLGFGLDGGGALIDYGLIERETQDVDIHQNNFDADNINKAFDAIQKQCELNGWTVSIVTRFDYTIFLEVETPEGSVQVELSQAYAAQPLEERPTSGLRFAMCDVIGNKIHAFVDRTADRDVFDVCSILSMGYRWEELVQHAEGVRFRTTVEELRQILSAVNPDNLTDLTPTQTDFAKNVLNSISLGK